MLVGMEKKSDSNVDILLYHSLKVEINCYKYHAMNEIAMEQGLVMLLQYVSYQFCDGIVIS